MPTADNLLDLFLNAIASERNAADNTIEAYRRDIQAFLLFLKQNKTTVDLKNTTESDVFDFRCALEQQNLRPASIARKLTALRRLFDFLFHESIIQSNPTRNIHLPKNTRPLPKILEKDEVFAVLENAAHDTTPEGRRRWLLFELLYGAGLRVSELVTLKIGNFHVNMKTREFENDIIVKGKGGKERIIPIHETCLEALVAYLEVRHTFCAHSKRNSNSNANKAADWLFPSSSKAGFLTRQRVAQLLKETAESVGLDPAKLSPHVMRHAFATHLLNGGANLLVIKKLLGHADVATTQIYTHIQTKRLAELIKKHHPLSKNEG
ncbi:MAG: tyrosine recombinase [Holosporales bacterium]|jgi:integrase/recombinase XerD|nr:tyrosine recombinase [Holosporales bacterium]